jgi:hypothetical protein
MPFNIFLIIFLYDVLLYMSWSIFVNPAMSDKDDGELEQLNQYMLVTLFNLLKEQSSNNKREVLALALMVKKMREDMRQGQLQNINMTQFETMIVNIRDKDIKLPEVEQYNDVINSLMNVITAFEHQEGRAYVNYAEYIESRSKTQHHINNILRILGGAALIPGVVFLGLGLVVALFPAFSALITTGITYEFIAVGITFVTQAIFLMAGSDMLSNYLTNIQQDLDNAESIRLGTLSSLEQAYQEAIETICDEITIVEDEAQNQSVASQAKVHSPLLANSMLANNKVQRFLNDVESNTVRMASHSL